MQPEYFRLGIIRQPLDIGQIVSKFPWWWAIVKSRDRKLIIFNEQVWYYIFG